MSPPHALISYLGVVGTRTEFGVHKIKNPREIGRECAFSPSNKFFRKLSFKNLGTEV